TARLQPRHSYRKDRNAHPVAIGGAKALEQRARAYRSNDLKRCGSGRQHAIPEHEYQRREIGVMIDVKVRERHMTDRLPFDAQLGEPTGDAAAAVEEEANPTRFDEIPGAAPRRRERDRSRAEGADPKHEAA